MGNYSKTKSHNFIICSSVNSKEQWYNDTLEGGILEAKANMTSG